MRFLPVLIAVFTAISSLAEDLQSSDGTVYHRIKVVQTEPDGVIFQYDKGIAKVDFEKLPLAMQRQFGFDPHKAAAYRASEAAVMQENQRIVKKHEDEELERIRKMMESGASGDELTYGGGMGPAARTEARRARQIQRQMEEKEEVAIAAARQPRTFWNAPFWNTPVAKFIGAVFGGGGSHGGEGVINNGAGFDNHRGFSR
jgi:hypothetical protein